MTTDAPFLYRFGGFEADPQRRLLYGSDGRSVPLTAKQFSLLLYLIDHRNEVVGKEVLLGALWPNVIVEENNLTQAISGLRHALGERPREHRFIVTVPGQGYKFVADVDAVHRHETPDRTGRVDGQRDGTVWQKPGIVHIALFVGALLLSALIIVAVLRDAQDSLRDDVMRLTDFELISTFPGNHTQPSLSPDGALVAFVSDASGSPQIWVRGVDQGEPLQVTHDPAGAAHPAWSPEGGTILFHSLDGGIWAVGPLGTPPPRRIIAEGRNPNFSADGSLIVYESGREIRMAQENGTGQRSVPGVPSHDWAFMPAYPALSPDGREIVLFIQQAGPFGDLWIQPSAGGHARQLTFDNTYTGKPAWTPDGDWIVFPSRRDGARNLWRVPAAGGEPVPVTTGVGEDGDPVISRSGSKLVYTNTDVTTRMVATDPETREREVLHESRTPSWFPEVSPDGRQIAFFAETAPRDQIFVMDIDGTDVRQLTFDDGRNLNVMPRWSPDGRAIIYYAEVGSQSLRRLSLAEGSSTEILPDFPWLSKSNLELNPDGKRASFVRVEHSDRVQRRVVVLDLETMTETLLDPMLKYKPSWSKDGERVLGTGLDEVLICPADGSECDTVIESVSRVATGERNPRPAVQAKWSWDQTRIFFARPTTPGMYQLWEVDRDGSNPRRLFEYGPVSPYAPFFEVMPDDRILWTHYDRSRTELWLATLNRNDSGS